jgi:hypothetical protein
MLDGHSKKKDRKAKNKDRIMYGAPFHYQVAILLGRTWKTIWREKVPSILVFSREIGNNSI